VDIHGDHMGYFNRRSHSRRGGELCYHGSRLSIHLYHVPTVDQSVKYLLIVFFSMPQNWPFPERLDFAQLGPFDTLLACEKAASQAEHIAVSIGAHRTGSFCAGTKDANWRVK
jgi:hypothetical protein